MDAPAELSLLGLDRERFKRSDSKAWRGPCPQCGGKRRFAVFTYKPFPKWICVCDHCHLKVWADQLVPSLKSEISPAEREKWTREREERTAKELDAQRIKRERLVNERPWIKYHSKLNKEHRSQWLSWGISDEWQDKLLLGYCIKQYIDSTGARRSSPAYVIPYFHTEMEFITLQYRLFNCPNPNDRYRFEYGLGTSYYQTAPDKPIGKVALITEGVKKGIVTKIYGGLDLSVLSIPSKSDFAGVVNAVKHCKKVYVLLDPDAELWAIELCTRIGTTSKMVILPEKIDDLILKDVSAAPAILSTALGGI